MNSENNFSNKNILMIGWELPPFNSGGLGVACFFMAEALSKKVNLIFALPKKLPITNTSFQVIFAEDSDEMNKGNFSAYGNAKMIKEVDDYGEKLFNVIQNKNLHFDLIHSHDWLSASAAIYLKEKLGIPAIVHVHATEIERTGLNPDNKIFQKEKENFNKADKVITVSHQTKKIVKNYYGISKNKVIVVPNGIELKENPAKLPEHFSKLKQQGYKLVLFVGRFVLQKGPDYLLETLPLVKNYVKVKYIFCGNGEMIERLISRANELNVLQNIIFTGFLRDEKLWGIYQIADLLVVPSVFDPFGLVPLEGIKYNTPVIISKTTGVENYLINVLKTDFWDIKKMANLIISALKYPAMHSELVKNSYQELPKFDWENRISSILNIYQNL